MPSRRTALLGLLGLSSSLVARANPAKPDEEWVTHNGAVDGAPGSYFAFGTLDGRPQIWTAHNAGHAYSCRLGDGGKILRLELRAGDQWPDDVAGGTRSERTMVQAMTGFGSPVSQALPLATDVWWAFSFLIEPGAPVSGLGAGYEWLVFADLHSDFAASHARAVPLRFECDAGDYFAVEANGTNLHPDNSRSEIYRTPAAIARGKWHDIVARIDMDPSGAHSAADIFLDGERIVAFTGPLGFVGDLPYPQFQIYRGNPDPKTRMHESVAIRYANHDMITSGSLEHRIHRSRRRNLFAIAR